jgi:hypothetical protein
MNYKYITKYLSLFVLGIIANFQTVLSQEIKIITNPDNNHRYLLTPEMTWQEAENFARDMGGHLVTINDQLENQWLMQTFVTQNTQFLWIGINDQERENQFFWSSGENSQYQNWAKGEPNNNPKQGGEDFGVLNGLANPFNRPLGTWSDAPKHAKLRGIVEIP